MKKTKEQKGITLIALIITIVILLILAVVAIRAVQGGRIIEFAKRAKDEHKEQELKEAVLLAYNNSKIGDITKSTTLEQELGKIKGATVEKVDMADLYYVSRDGYMVSIYSDGTVCSGKIDVWDGSVDVPEVKEFAWHIETAAQLKFLEEFVNNGNTLTDAQKELIAQKGYSEEEITLNSDTTVYLMNNIDLGAKFSEDGTKTEGNEWIPIGKSNKTVFKGAFQGNNYTIRGMYISSTDNFVGLFGCSTSKIQNLNIQNSYVKGNMGVGGIVGGIKETIENCNNINTTVIASGSFGGGIVGLTNANIINCKNSGTTNAQAQAAGIAGAIEAENEVIISGCENIGNVTTDSDTSGGIAGQFVDTSGNGTIGKIENCTNAGVISAGKNSDGMSQAGGILGLGGEINIYNCANSGIVTGTGTFAGGICGSNTGTIELCSNNGAVKADSYVRWNFGQND